MQIYIQPEELKTNRHPFAPCIVVHYILDVENASREIFGILSGDAPPSAPNNRHHYLGNKLYGTGEALRPRAVLFGGTYDDGAVERICEDLLLLLRQLRTRTRPIAAATTTATTQIPLLKANQSAAMPPLGPEYGRKIVQRAKACLQKLEEEGKFDGTHGGVYIY
ncbi:uncharacterized protein PG998_009437 [Apiospora kogelbergensis]|uniref:uncharacterized protein n=1 Tax=Apiospora kogelbergensis TaxID=1337665 RepID=UPI00312D1E0B